MAKEIDQCLGGAKNQDRNFVGVKAEYKDQGIVLLVLRVG